MNDYFDKVGAQLSELTRQDARSRRRMTMAVLPRAHAVRTLPPLLRLTVATVLVAAVIAIIVLSTGRAGSGRFTAVSDGHTVALTVRLTPASARTNLQSATWKVTVHRAPGTDHPSTPEFDHITIDVNRLPSVEGSLSYAVWLIGANGTADSFLGFVIERPFHEHLTVMGGVTAHGTFGAIELTIESGGLAPKSPGEIVLRGRLKLKT